MFLPPESVITPLLLIISALSVFNCSIGNAMFSPAANVAPVAELLMNCAYDVVGATIGTSGPGGNGGAGGKGGCGRGGQT